MGDQFIERRQARRDEIRRMTERLVAEYAGLIPAGGVMRVVARAQEQLRTTGGDEDIVDRTEVLARSRLSRRFAAHSAA